jgi:hypothetical protein
MFTPRVGKSTFERSPWYAEIEKELESRNNKCRLQGMNKIYFDEGDPYKYKDVYEYVRNNPFKAANCKLRKYPDRSTDKYKRYYKDAYDEKDCQLLNGVWDDKTLSRTNRAVNGTCWVTPEDSDCARNYEVKQLLRRRENPTNKDWLIGEGSKKCNRDQSCSWIKLNNGHDCFSRKAALNIQGKVMDPPSTMPKDLTKDGIEKYVYDWYVNRIHGQPPQTTELFGEGNRCSPSAKKAAQENERRKKLSPEELATLDPLKVPDMMLLERAIGADRLAKYALDRKYWRTIKGVEFVEDFTKMPLYEGKRIEDEAEEEKEPENQMFPSVPQSVVNMLMKNIAKTNSTNRGLMAWHSTGSGKCFKKGTLILMFDGSTKPVENVQVGDLVMGDDSTPRTVLSLGRGQDDMYDIIPMKGESYTVNSEHILVLKWTGKNKIAYSMKHNVNLPWTVSYFDKQSVRIKEKSFKTHKQAQAYLATFTPEHKILHIEVRDYLNLHPTLQKQLKGIRAGVEFKAQKVPFDPYMIGYFLGGGTISGLGKRSFKLLHTIQQHDLIKSPHIPDVYKVNSREVRLQMLAGIIDSHGHYNMGVYNCLQKNCIMANDIAYLARSLGLAAHITKHKTSYRVCISGNRLNDVPVKILRNKATIKKHGKDALVTSIAVKHAGFDDYYGFTLNGNHRFLLGDFTITHNTCTATGVFEAFWDTDRQIVFASSLDAIASNPDYKFHECGARLYPRFQKEPYTGKTEQERVTKVGEAFEKRGVIFVSFAKLANRIEKTEKFKKLMGIQSGVKRSWPKLLGGGGATKKVAAKTRSSKKKEQEAVKKTAIKKVATKKTSKTTSKTTSKSTSKSTSKKATKAKTESVKVVQPVAEPKQPKREKKTITQGDSPMSRLIDRICKWYDLNDRDVIRANLKQCNINDHDEFIDLDNAVLVIDEVHNLFRPLATQRERHNYVETHIVDPTVHPNLKVVILTATPGDNVPDVMKLINIVRDPTTPVIRAPNVDVKDDIDRFKSEIRGMVSFFDMSNDLTKFPQISNTGPIKYPMSSTQFARYVEAYKEIKADMKNYEKLAKANQLNKFWQGARKYANMLYNFEKTMKLTEFSSKLPALLENVEKYSKEKHYIYSAFYENRGSSQGILEIARQLEAKGYTKLTVKEAKELNRAGKLPPIGKRFVLAIQSEIGEEGSSMAGKNLHELIKLYNSSVNKNGDYIHVFLASQGFNEGIDLKGVRHVHIFEPLVTMASDMQTIGRARRYCSHSDLDKDKGEWTVKIHRYMSDFPIELSRPKVPEMEERIKEMEIKLQDLEAKLAAAGKTRAKDEEQKAYKENLKNMIKSTKASIKEANAELKQVQKLDLQNIKNIDEFVFNEAREKMKQLFTVYHAMKETAVDCRILSKFHNQNLASIDTPIKCATFGSEPVTRPSTAIGSDRT